MMISLIKKMFSTKNMQNNTLPFNEEYVQNQSVKLFFPDGQLEFTVNKKYPLPIKQYEEGESLMFSDCLLVNILWLNIKDEERDFLKSLLEGISIYEDEATQLTVIVFIFSGRPVILPVVDYEENVREWAKKNVDAMVAFFFLTESSNKKIKQIRNINLPMDFFRTLQILLAEYKRPDISQLQNRLNTIETETLIRQARFRWIYVKDEDEFRFISPEIKL